MLSLQLVGYLVDDKMYSTLAAITVSFYTVSLSRHSITVCNGLTYFLNLFTAMKIKNDCIQYN